MNILSLVNQNLDIFYQIQTKCYRNSDTVFFSSIHRTKRGLGMTMSVDPDRGVSGACTQQPQPTGKKIACKQYAACRRGNIAWMAYACLSSFSVDVVGARMDDSARLELKAKARLAQTSPAAKSPLSAALDREHRTRVSHRGYVCTAARCIPSQCKASFSSVNWGRKTLYQNSCSISFVFDKNYLNFD
jgi:hypothetical protein